jgi:hypothetical protein
VAERLAGGLRFDDIFLSQVISKFDPRDRHRWGKGGTDVRWRERVNHADVPHVRVECVILHRKSLLESHASVHATGLKVVAEELAAGGVNGQ